MGKLYGLVVCGGKSSRMGTDKSLLIYHSLPQRYYLYEMLQSLCGQAFISCNRQQLEDIPPSYNTIPDNVAYGDIGPMNALLSAFDRFPDASFLVVGCDYPLLQKSDLEELIGVFALTGKSVSFYNEESNFIEPLLAVYHDNIKYSLHKNFKLKNYSLRMLLEEQNARKISCETPGGLKSKDSPEDYRATLKFLKNR